MKALILVLLTFTSFAKTESWLVDSAHTKVGFEIQHMIISSVEGKFKDFSGEIFFDPKKLSAKDFKFNGKIQSKSIDTGNEKRDKHLRSADFFNVKKHTTLEFKSKKFVSTGKSSYDIIGTMTIAGKTKEVTFKTKYLGTMEAYDVKRVAFVAKTTIKREDFGLTWNDGEVKASNVAGRIIESAGAIGSDVDITLKIQAKRKADL